MATEEDIARLVVALEAKVSDFQKKMDAAEKRGSKTYQTLQRGSKRATDQMASDMSKGAGRINQALAAVSGNIGSFGKAFAGGLIGGAVTGAFAAITDNLRETVRGVAEVGDEAKKSGLGVQAFQEWSYVAEQNRVSIDALTDGFKELSLRADEWIKTGSGSGAESFQRLGFTADDLAKRLKNPSDLMLEIVRRLQRFDQAARIRIMDELFGGTGGEQFVQLIDQGADGLQKTIQRAHDVGAVLDSEMIDKAQEIDRQWSDLTARVSNFAKTVAVELANIPWNVVNTKLSELFSNEQVGRSILGDKVYEALKEMGALTDEQVTKVETLRDRYSGLSDAAQDVGLQLAAAASTADMLGNDALWQVLATASADMRALSDQFAQGKITGEQFAEGMDGIRKKAADALEQLDSIDKAQFSGVISALGGLGRKLLDLIDNAKTLKAALPGGSAAIEDTRGEAISEARSGSYDQSSPYAPTTSPTPKAAPPMISEGTGSTGGSSKKSGSSKKTVQDQIDEIAQDTAALQAQTAAFNEAIGKGTEYGDMATYAATKAKLLTAAQQEGKTVTPELAAEIEKVAQAYGKAAQGSDEARDNLARMKAEATAGANALSNVFLSVTDGVDGLKSALASLLQQIASAQMNKAFASLATSGGTTGSIFSAIGSLIGGYASGGYTGDGGRNEPAGVVHRGEYVFSKAATARIGAGNLDAMHRGAIKGYASGGYVGGSTGSASGGASSVKVDVGVTVDKDGNLQAYVKNVSQQEVSRAAPSIVSQSVKATQNHLVKSRMINSRKTQ